MGGKRRDAFPMGERPHSIAGGRGHAQVGREDPDDNERGEERHPVDKHRGGVGRPAKRVRTYGGSGWRRWAWASVERWEFWALPCLLHAAVPRVRGRQPLLEGGVRGGERDLRHGHSGVPGREGSALADRPAKAEGWVHRQCQALREQSGFQQCVARGAPVAREGRAGLGVLRGHQHDCTGCGVSASKRDGARPEPVLPRGRVAPQPGRQCALRPRGRGAHGPCFRQLRLGVDVPGLP
mmetsp:Transcript_13453/g.33781  ORF Transcript_13453/g.33781 Transcript_13453/m.33781 type:complete len:238 (-) Transcript_13453:75-788(-)